jgi:hypothetical protein
LDGGGIFCGGLCRGGRGQSRGGFSFLKRLDQILVRVTGSTSQSLAAFRPA